MKMPNEPLHGVLPVEVQLKLRSAAATPDNPRDPLARQKAVEAAVEWARHHYPEYFKH